MKVIGMGKKNITDGKVFDVSQQVGEILISKGLVYLDGEDKPKTKTTKRKK